VGMMKVGEIFECDEDEDWGNCESDSTKYVHNSVIFFLGKKDVN
jgi:hypothetical protein